MSNCQEKLLVGIRRFLFVVDIVQGAQSLYVVPNITLLSIKSLRHEMGATIFFEESALHHVHARSLGH